ncbi:MAG: putative toxin-antitoxin system toxin component, PIN family [Bacteroidales bacterium]|nr:MAG: putative toxin-antitoxin system toxin component, PIN family [Bacteroidales bacterium]
MLRKKTRLILDTNFWISYLITDKFRYLDVKIFDNTVQLVFSEELIDEFISVSQREKFSRFFEKKDVEKLIELFSTFGILYKTISEVTDCRDPKDNFLLNLAIDSNADYLATGDKDLLILKQIGKTRIITLYELELLLR